jgi:hypothetical protein
MSSAADQANFPTMIIPRGTEIKVNNIQGTLTAWKVHAKRITLEDRAKAFIMLQESEYLELSRSARLVGNFANEKELYLMMGKFTPQLKELPGAVDMGSHHQPQIPSAARVDDGDHLRAAQALLEREISRTDLGQAEAEAIREVLYGLRERNAARVNLVYRDAFAELRTPSENLRQAREHLDRYFAAHRQ